MTISRSMYDSPTGGGNTGGGMPDWLKSAFGMGTGAAGIGSGLMGLFGGHNDPSKGAMSFLDQIPGLSKYFQPYADMESKINFASTQFVADRQSEERYNQIYCLGKYARQNQGYVDDNPTTAWELEQAFRQNVSSTDNYGNPLEDVLGG